MRKHAKVILCNDRHLRIVVCENENTIVIESGGYSTMGKCKKPILWRKTRNQENTMRKYTAPKKFYCWIFEDGEITSKEKYYLDETRSNLSERLVYLRTYPEDYDYWDAMTVYLLYPTEASMLQQYGYLLETDLEGKEILLTLEGNAEAVEDIRADIARNAMVENNDLLIDMGRA